MNNKVAFISAMSLLSCSAFANIVEDKKDDAHQRLNASADMSQTETIVVTGTRTAKFLNDSPVAVTVISGDALTKVSQGTLAQALNFIPGVVVTRSVKDGYNIQMQGFDGDHVLVLINGQPVVSPTGSSTDLDQIAAVDIQQIEVIRGAASVMYGSSAMGGVINIITNSSNDERLKLSYDISQYAKENRINSSDINQTLKIAAAKELFGWNTSLNVVHIKDEGFDYNSDSVSQDSPVVEKTFFNVSSQNDNSELTPSISYQLLDEVKLRDTSSVPGQTSVIFYQTSVNKHQLDLGLAQKQSKEPWQINARYITHEETSGQSNSLRDIDIKLAELTGQNVWQVSDIEVVAGGVLHADELNQIKPGSQSVEIDDQSRESAEGFVQANWIKPSYQVLSGVRVQHDSDFGWHHAFRLSGMLNFDVNNTNLQWRLGAGQSYRVPNLKERFYVFDHSNLGYMVLGNEQLTPETANSINSSLRINKSVSAIDADMHFEFNAHYSDTEDFIESVQNVDKSEEANLSIFEYKNRRSALIHGFNVTSGLTFEQSKIQFNYSYLTSQDENGERLASRPRHQVKVNFSYDINAYDIELLTYLVYQADEAVPNDYLGVENNEYTTVNFVFNQEIFDGLTWRLNLNNLFDEHESEHADAARLFDPRPTSTRTISAGVTYTF